MTVAVGIAGWSYADWRGIVYPRGCKDDLRFAARHVDCVEINSTFYHLPRPEVCASWHERTADLPLFFTAKVPGEVTHAKGGHDVLDSSKTAALQDALMPLREAGRLRCVLAQFHARFAPSSDALRFLAKLAAGIAPLGRGVLELRHRDWADADHQARLLDMGWSIVQIDYPGSARIGGGGFDGESEGRSFGKIGYLRLHGRNTAAWARDGAPRDEVYDYTYPEGERAEIVDRVRVLEAAEDAAETIVIANNHFEGQALKLALELRAALSGKPVSVPDSLLAKYPGLRSIATGLLF